MHTGQRKGEGWRAGQGGRDPTLECGHRINGKKSIYKRGNPSVLVSASIVLALLVATNVFGFTIIDITCFLKKFLFKCIC